MSDVSDAKSIGGWTILGKLGRGGNADVYRAVRNGQEYELALKVIKATNVEREPYQRFVREVETLRSISPFPGVLPPVDAHLPDTPSRRDPAWLAMPIAVPIEDALRDASLEIIVTAVATIAGTLTRLKQEHKIGHRDIKPGNLYEFDSRWCIGDFGLVAVPDLERLTRDGKQVGPAHYTAYEMIRDPVNADSFPADVYSLAKTLWALTTGQRFPPLGHQEAGVRDYAVAELRPHPHADALDRLIDIATLLQPEKRPTMEQFAADLEAWMKLANEGTDLDISGLGSQIRAKMKNQLEQEDIEEHLKKLGLEAVRLVQGLLRPLQEAFKEVHPHPELNLINDELTRNILLSLPPYSANVVFKWQTCDRLPAGEPLFAYSLRFGRSLEVFKDGNVAFRWRIQVGREKVSGGHFWQQEKPARARVGSIEAERMLQEEIENLMKPLTEALRVFAEELPPH